VESWRCFATGFGVHEYLHRSHALERWALFRLVTEVVRSVREIGGFHVYLEHLFTLPFPSALRPLLRTISVLHLHSTSASGHESWEKTRTAYVEKRLDAETDDGQIKYHTATGAAASTARSMARNVFVAAAVLAFSATLVKLLVILGAISVEDHAAEQLTALMGGCAIVLPLVAVGALTLAAAFDLEARQHTSEEMLDFLRHQRELLVTASSPREYGRLLIETESRLLGETVTWYARRSFVGVA
jgi:hypothetical protein